MKINVNSLPIADIKIHLDRRSGIAALLIIFICCWHTMYAQDAQHIYFTIREYSGEETWCRLMRIEQRKTASTIDTLLMIEELLAFEGNNCPAGYMTFNCLSCSTGYPQESEPTVYSVQVYALCLINTLYFSFPPGDEYYSPSQRLREGSRIASVDGPLVEQAFQCYKEWFAAVKVVGLEQAREQQLYPLSNCSVQWDRGYIR